MAIKPAGGRPPPLNVGNELKVYTNYYKMTFNPSMVICHYHVKYEPEPKNAESRRRIWMNAKAGSSPASNLGFYDGRASLYAIGQIKSTEAKFDPSEGKSGDGNKQKKATNLDHDGADKDGKDGKGRRGPTVFKITFELVNEIKLHALDSFIAGKSDYNADVMTGLQALDVALAYPYFLQDMTFGNVVVNLKSNYHPIPGNLNMYAGLYFTARPASGALFLNANVNYKAFHAACPLWKYIEGLRSRRGGHQSEPNHIREVEKYQDREIRLISNKLKGIKVTPVHRTTKSGKPVVFSIDSLTRDDGTRVKFTLEDKQGGGPSKEVSVHSYFSSKYNVKDRGDLPVVKVSGGNYFPIQCLEVLEGKKYRGKLGDEQMAKVVEFAAEAPEKRKETIDNLLAMLKINDQKSVKDIKSSVDRNMTELTARVIEGPKLRYNGRDEEPNFGSWNMRGAKVFSTDDVAPLAFIFIRGGRLNRESGADFMALMKPILETFRNTGISIPEKDADMVHITVDMNRFDAKRDISQLIDEVRKQKKGKDPKLIIIVIPRKEVAIYSEIKRVGDTELGIPTQVIVQDKLTRFNVGTAANIALKVNVKNPSYKAVNTVLRNMPKFFSNEPSMIFGIDINHGVSSDASPSIAAVVGSYDRFGTRYSSTYKLLEGRREVLGDHLRSMIITVLNRFVSTTQAIPFNAIVFRDGVSDGEFEAVCESEIPIFQAVLQQYLDDSRFKKVKLKLLYIITQKRNNTRFFHVNPPRSSNPNAKQINTNCPSGLFVDNKVVSTRYFDFFLQSQAPLKGTCRPCRYIVLKNDLDISPEDLVRFVYHQSFLYQRCTRAVGQTAAAYYAHLVCARARVYLKDSFSDIDTVASGGSNKALEVRDIPAVKGSVPRSMYYM